MNAFYFALALGLALSGVGDGTAEIEPQPLAPLPAAGSVLPPGSIPPFPATLDDDAIRTLVHKEFKCGLAPDDAEDSLTETDLALSDEFALGLLHVISTDPTVNYPEFRDALLLAGRTGAPSNSQAQLLFLTAVYSASSEIAGGFLSVDDHGDEDETSAQQQWLAGRIQIHTVVAASNLPNGAGTEFSRDALDAPDPRVRVVAGVALAKMPAFPYSDDVYDLCLSGSEMEQEELCALFQ